MADFVHVSQHPLVRHKLSMLRDKVRVIPTLGFNGAPTLDLDGRDNYPQVLEAALTAARTAIASKPAPRAAG